MKKWISILLAVCTILSIGVSFPALADQEIIDLDTMSPAELQDLINRATAEYEEATKINSEDSDTIEKIFKASFVSMMPKDTTYWYPFWGLNKTCMRSMFRVNGDCSVRLPGESSKKAYDGLTLLLWKNDAGEFETAAFFDDDEIFQLDQATLQKIRPNMLAKDAERLGAENENIELAAATTAAPSPTTAPEPTSAVTSAEALAAMSAEEAVQTVAKECENAVMTYSKTLVIDGDQIILYANIGDAWDEADAVLSACRYALKIMERVFVNPGIKNLHIYFNTNLRDPYGNVSSDEVMYMNISRDTAGKINYEWMNTEVYRSTKSFLQILDQYTVHPALLEGVK